MTLNYLVIEAVIDLILSSNKPFSFVIKCDDCKVSEESDLCKPKPKQGNLTDTDISGDFSNEFDGTGRRFIEFS